MKIIFFVPSIDPKDTVNLGKFDMRCIKHKHLGVLLHFTRKTVCTTVDPNLGQSSSL